jgi:RimK family alpha-L-glutamate ligase
MLSRALSARVDSEQLTPQEALEVLRPGDAVLGRLDVLPTLDGVEDGLWVLGALAARNVVVLNSAAALVTAHDKLLTARLLHRHSLPHPRTVHVRDGRAAPPFTRPVVVKPRYGSWGQDVHRCDDESGYASTMELVRGRDWYPSHGVLVQELVRPRGYDLRVVVAGGCVVGAVHRIAAEGEWRTNVALGAVRRAVASLPRAITGLALAAARLLGCSLAGIDLVPDEQGGWMVLEVTGAVEFTADYTPWGDVFEDAAFLLEHEARRLAEIASEPTSSVSGG